MRYSVVTTFHKPGYELYGKRMIQSFLQNWPKDVTLYVYHQDIVPAESAPNVVYRDLNQVSELKAFKDKWKNDPKATGWTNDSTRRQMTKRKKSGLSGMLSDFHIKCILFLIVLEIVILTFYFGWMRTWYVTVPLELTSFQKWLLYLSILVT